MAEYVEACVYAQIEAELSASGLPLTANVVRITKKRPTQRLEGTLLVKLTLRIPAAAFKPVAPEVVVVIPDYLTEPAPIEVQADDPGEER